jgi:uncharacterized protein YbjT (DUF2867 family)
MTIAVTTPTGNVGSHVIRALARGGERPLALLRDPSRLDPKLRDLVGVRVVDQFEPSTVVAATTDVDTIYWVDPTTGSADPLGDYALATESVVRAVRENGVGRVVFQSSVGAEKRHGAGEIDGLASTEVALDGLGVDVVHLRCGFFFTNLMLQLEAVRGGTVPIVVPPDMPMAWVDPRDIAEVAAARLLSRSWSGRVVQAVHGPEDLGWGRAAEIVTEATGHPVDVQQVADDAMRDLLRSSGMTPALAEAVLGMSTGLREDFAPEQPRTVTSTTPSTLAAWAHEHLTPLLR